MFVQNQRKRSGTSTPELPPLVINELEIQKVIDSNAYILVPGKLNYKLQITNSHSSLQSSVFLFQFCYFIDNFGERKKICFLGEKNRILKYDLTTERWELTVISNVIFQIQFYSAACSLPDGNILITGGGHSYATFYYNEKNGNLSSKLSLITITDTLTKLCPMKEIRKEHAAVRLGTYCFAIGGYNGLTKKFTSTAERFDLLTNTWTSIPNMHNGKPKLRNKQCINRKMCICCLHNWLRDNYCAWRI